MARSRGFEPLTAWFVARYSIQLSYERAMFNDSIPIYSIRVLPFSLDEIKVARPRGFEPLTAWFVARYSIQLSYGRAGFLLFSQSTPEHSGALNSGALERIRTSDRLVRSQVLYPAELRARRL